MITCRSAAKINLSLDILARRADGYHELQSVAHTVGLWDALTFEFHAEPGVSLQCNRADLAGEDNLCLKAVRAWFNEARQCGVVNPPGLHITLTKHIPSGAGLGGGSGNATATLLALNRHFNDLLDRHQLVRLAATLGADVPFFLRGGCALFEGIGERLTPLPTLDAWVLVVQPDKSLNTAVVYKHWDELGSDSVHGSDALQRAVVAGDVPVVGRSLSNDLRRAAQAAGVDINAIIADLSDCGALGVEMTGSGSAVFALFDAEAPAWAAAQKFRAKEIAGINFAEVAPLCRQGVEFEPSLAP